MTQEQDTQDFLAHYGIKGMRWGVVRNNPTGSESGGSSGPKPLSERKTAKAVNLEARAAKANVRLSEINDDIAALPPGIRSAYNRSTLNKMAKTQESYRDDLQKAAEATREGRLTSNQKKMIAGGVAIGLIGGFVAYSSLQNSGQLNAMKLNGQAFLKGNKSPFKKNPLFEKQMDSDGVLKNVVPGINPAFRESGGQMNCRRCSFVYELRRRGYDVEATTSAVGWGQSATGQINALTPGEKNISKMTSLSQMVVSGDKGIRTQVPGDNRTLKAFTDTVKDAKDHDSFLSTLNKQPVGARGEAVFNFGGFGHSLSYEKFPDGKTYIMDTQKGKSYDVNNKADYMSFLEKWGIANVTNVELTRLDNVPLDENFLARWATNVK